MSRPYPKVSTPLIRELRETPKTFDELEITPNSEENEYVGILNIPAHTDFEIEEIYFLYGDEREAIRRLMECNMDYVEWCFSQIKNPLEDSLNDSLYTKFCEEYYWYHDGDIPESELDNLLIDCSDDAEWRPGKVSGRNPDDTQSITVTEEVLSHSCLSQNELAQYEADDEKIVYSPAEGDEVTYKVMEAGGSEGGKLTIPSKVQIFDSGETAIVEAEEDGPVRVRKAER